MPQEILKVYQLFFHSEFHKVLLYVLFVDKFKFFEESAGARCEIPLTAFMISTSYHIL